MSTGEINLPLQELPTYSSASALPMIAVNGQQAVTLDTHEIYIYNGTSWIVVASPGDVSAITALMGDVSANGPGSAAATIEAIQGNTVSGTTGTGNVVFSQAPTFSVSITAPLLQGGTAAGAPLTIQSTSNGTYGQITLQNLNGLAITPSGIPTTPDGSYVDINPTGPPSGTTNEIGLILNYTSTNPAATGVYGGSFNSTVAANSNAGMVIQGFNATADLGGNYSGVGTTIGTLGSSFSQNTGYNIAFLQGNFGSNGQAGPVYTGTSTGLYVGSIGLASLGAVNVGTFGYVDGGSGQTSIGTLGLSVYPNTGNSIGGYFWINSTDPSVLPSSASNTAVIIGENGISEADLIQLYSNGSLLFKVDKSGGLTLNTTVATPASGVGTITNLPTGYSGNPAGYIQFTIGGVPHIIPFW